MRLSYTGLALPCCWVVENKAQHKFFKSDWSWELARRRNLSSMSWTHPIVFLSPEGGKCHLPSWVSPSKKSRNNSQFLTRPWKVTASMICTHLDQLPNRSGLAAEGEGQTVDELVNFVITQLLLAYICVCILYSSIKLSCCWWIDLIP